MVPCRDSQTDGLLPILLFSNIFSSSYRDYHIRGRGLTPGEWMSGGCLMGVDAGRMVCICGLWLDDSKMWMMGGC